jgi:hypothetical protein
MSATNEKAKLYPVLSPIRKGGVAYKPDPSKVVPIELTDREAAELRAVGAIGEALPVDDPKPAKK